MTGGWGQSECLQPTDSFPDPSQHSLHLGLRRTTGPPPLVEGPGKPSEEGGRRCPPGLTRLCGSPSDTTPIAQEERDGAEARAGARLECQLLGRKPPWDPHDSTAHPPQRHPPRAQVIRGPSVTKVLVLDMVRGPSRVPGGPRTELPHGALVSRVHLLTGGPGAPGLHHRTSV
ncbi:hypothetical protein Cadr_000004030 [Camelus dromedarius]|uniref:Uncharacterized protein n=1 Tax=Camelus dromedarius TaxID=9838 RepID=A0A5N4ED56_CAMDR|nr:hypothetical protein Cadr_000004030 [Camelus dromedarius]